MIGIMLTLSIAASIRSFVIREYPKGEKRYIEAPNELATVYVGKMVDKGFFGGTSEYYEIEVVREFPESNYKARVFLDRYDVREIGGSVDLNAIDKIVEWAAQSQFVRIRLGNRPPIQIDVPI